MSSSYDIPDLPADDAAALRSSFKLVRLQVLTPLSVLVSIGANLVCGLLLKPSLTEIAAAHPNLLSPNPNFVAIYWLVIYLWSIVLCLQLVLFTRSDEAKTLFTKGVGHRFSLANYLMVGWVVFYVVAGRDEGYGIGWAWWVDEGFLLANALNLFSIYFTLFRNTPTTGYRRNIDTLSVHLPVRMMLVVIFTLDWLDVGMNALKWGWVPSGGEVDYSVNEVPAILALLAVNLVGLAIVFVMKDGVWALSATYLLVALLFSKHPTPAGLYGVNILLIALYPITYIASFIFYRVKNPRIVLGETQGPPVEEEV